MVDLNESPNIDEQHKDKFNAEKFADSIRQDVDGVLDMQINTLANSGDVGIDPAYVPEFDEDATGMTDDSSSAIDDYARIKSYTDGAPVNEKDREYVEKEREVAVHANNANEMTTQMGDAVIAILKLLNYYDTINMKYTAKDLQQVIPQLTGVGITLRTIGDLMFMLATRDFIIAEPRFADIPWAITAKGRAFLIIDYNLSNISNL